MNERIEKLFEQALEEFKAENKYATIIVPNPLKEKFAELIVRECCIALNPMLRDMISRGQGVDLIKLHFGMNPKEITTAMLDTAIAQCEQELAKKKSGIEEPKGWICPKCGADRTKIACPLGFGATVDGRCPMVVTAQGVQE